jgi:hypothetical protein
MESNLNRDDSGAKSRETRREVMCHSELFRISYDRRRSMMNRDGRVRGNLS